MTDRERFLRCLLGQDVDRAPYWTFWGPWGSAWQRWIDEGKPADVTHHRLLPHDQPPCTLPVACGPCPACPGTVLSEDESYRVWTDSWGIVRRDRKHGVSMPEFVRFPVQGRDDWEAYKVAHLDPQHPDRLAGPWRERAAEWRQRGWPVQLGNYPDLTIFGGLRWLLGDEECLVAFYDQPDLVHDIMDHLCGLFVHLIDAVASEVRVDVVHVWEDMCGRQGPLISPAMWREFMGPCYRRIRAALDRHDIPILSVDTDGNPDAIVPPMLETGVNWLWPFEVAAGCDVNDYRARYPTLGMMGGIDKRALAVGPAAIDAELARIAPALAAGRYIPDLDHLVPDDVSWAAYQHYAAALRRLVVGAGG
ncbi:MAG: hypothetical protein IT204_04135 [Fimbriimonadaceae bacterium]|nr:hypothetical protein [Fimbriimonadaceae bacterium]